jgi:hypothetical protein
MRQTRLLLLRRRRIRALDHGDVTEIFLNRARVGPFSSRCRASSASPASAAANRKRRVDGRLRQERISDAGQAGQNDDVELVGCADADHRFAEAYP